MSRMISTVLSLLTATRNGCLGFSDIARHLPFRLRIEGVVLPIQGRVGDSLEVVRTVLSDSDAEEVGDSRKVILPTLTG
jgi:hypothetical protein